MININKIGIIGITGRMGQILATELAKFYQIGPSFSRNSQNLLSEVFLENDVIIDFSNAELTEQIINNALINPKTLLLCSTGWSQENFSEKLDQLSKIAPIIIAPNTSFGVLMQLNFARQLRKLLDENFEVDIHEVHHNQKIDIPSGTALELANSVKFAAKNPSEIQIATLTKGPRPKNFINISSLRIANNPGEHVISFTSDDEEISITHKAKNRKLFVNGVIKILDWLQKTQPKPGLYKMQDVIFGLTR